MDDKLTTEELAQTNFSPISNPDVISLVKQKDGNWRGFMQKNGALVQCRTVGPETALQILITHDGQ